MIRAFLFMFVFTSVLAGCATPSVGRCTPSSDLPAKKVLKKVPERVASPKNLFDLFVDERAEHGRTIRDYNSLYRQCVG